ncbi:MAG TPA: serine protease [Nitriliruptorales bacterium]|nr:serine protease [Nitriliruptorales bacterium]
MQAEPPVAGGREGDGDVNGGGWRERLFGGAGRLGWWTLPLFVAVGLLGAVLAGALAAVYYAQRVTALEQETAEARRELTGAVERVSEVAAEARAAIESEVAAVRDELAVRLPIDDPVQFGVVTVRAEVVERPPAPPVPQAGPTGQPPPPPPPPRTVVRTGSGFAVVVSEGDAFFVTSFAVVADPERPQVAVERAQVMLGGNRLTASVHAWDPSRDVALLRVDGLGNVAIPAWRSPDDPLVSGDRLFAVGLTPGGTLAQVTATVAAVDSTAVVIDAALPDVVRGGPLVDAEGRVVGVASTAYRPYGEASAAPPGVPVRLLCDRLIRCGAGDVPA